MKMSFRLVGRIAHVRHVPRGVRQLAHDVAGTSGPLRVASGPHKAVGSLPGAPASALTTKLHFFNSVLEQELIPTYRILDGSGNVIEGAEVPEMDRDFARKLYEGMMMLPTMDNIFYNVQRQGRLSFYMTAYGEEAIVIGSAAALNPSDEVLSQYREVGVALWRGCSVAEYMAQLFTTEHDRGKGRQMPVHYGSREFKYHTISSPLTTQIPQAAGVAYALKRDPARKDKDCAVCFFGEGAASEGDFHAGFNMASVIGGALVFICRNNGFAISTPATEQYHGDGIASRGPGYGMPTVRVDGNDALAVYSAVKHAREIAISKSTPVLVEAMTYRVGHHSTSDDSFAYRARQDVEDWKKIDNPLHRMRKFLESKEWWSEEEENSLKASQKKEVLDALAKTEKLQKPSLSNMFTDVYDEEPWNIREQRAKLRDLLNKYGDVWEPWKSELQKLQNHGKDV